MKPTPSIVAWLLLALLAIPAATTQAGLATDPNAYFDGSTTWRGSTAFASGGNLQGHVEWAVFAPGDFSLSYGGYTPTAGEFTYAYQVFSEGTPGSPISHLSVHVTGGATIADNIGSFADLAGQGPSSVSIGSSSADWFFGTEVIPGGSSSGLAYSSPFGPVASFGSIVDTGESAVAFPLPSPSPVPEPGTVVTWLVLGVCATAGAKLRRRLT